MDSRPDLVCEKMKIMHKLVKKHVKSVVLLGFTPVKSCVRQSGIFCVKFALSRLYEHQKWGSVGTAIESHFLNIFG